MKTIKDNGNNHRDESVMAHGIINMYFIFQFVATAKRKQLLESRQMVDSSSFVVIYRMRCVAG